MSNFYIEYRNINNMYWEFRDNLTELMTHIDEVESKINFVINDNFMLNGMTSVALKNYLREVHITCLEGLKAAAQDMIDRIGIYKYGYVGIDNSTGFLLPEDIIEDAGSAFKDTYNEACDSKQNFRDILSGISDIIDINEPSLQNIEEQHNEMDRFLKELVERVNTYEAECTAQINDLSEKMLSTIRNAVDSVGVLISKDSTHESYVSSYLNGNDPFAQLKGLTVEKKAFHKKFKVFLDELAQDELDRRIMAEHRKKVGYVTILSGGVYIVFAGIAEVGSFGAATPIIPALSTLANGVTVIFGGCDIQEALGYIYYGSVGDIDTKPYNSLKYNFFGNNDDAYVITEMAVATLGCSFGSMGSAEALTKNPIKLKGVIGKIGENTVSRVVSIGSGYAAQEVTSKITDDEGLQSLANVLVSLGVGVGIDSHFNKAAIARYQASCRAGINSATAEHMPSYIAGAEDISLGNYNIDIEGLNPGSAYLFGEAGANISPVAGPKPYSAADIDLSAMTSGRIAKEMIKDNSLASFIESANELPEGSYNLKMKKLNKKVDKMGTNSFFTASEAEMTNPSVIGPMPKPKPFYPW